MEYVIRLLLIPRFPIFPLDLNPKYPMKRSLYYLAASLGALTLAHADPVKITYWDFFGGGDGVRMKQIVEEFNKSQQDVQVTQTLAFNSTGVAAKARMIQPNRSRRYRTPAHNNPPSMIVSITTSAISHWGAA